jgi:hypothetical protein
VKRRIAKLAVFLLLGAVVNVAVAWGCALWVDRGQAKIATGRSLQGYIWVVRRGSAHGSEFVLSVRSYGDLVASFPGEGNWPPDLIPSWSTISLEIDPAGPKRYGFQTQMQDARGWPMLSMRCTFLRAWSGVGVRTRREVGGGLEMPPRILTSGSLSYRKARALPYIPIPLGFVVNTLSYAAFIGISITGALAGRRVIRRARGHCINCGYDLRGAEHEVCPECGQELRARAKV